MPVKSTGLPHPTVITESGRAPTAHHTVLVSNVIGVERNEGSPAAAPAEDAPRPVASPGNSGRDAEQGQYPLSARMAAMTASSTCMIFTQYAQGMPSLTERAPAEGPGYLNICRRIQQDPIRVTAHTVRLSMNCRNAWRINSM